MGEHHGNTLGEVVHKSLAREISLRSKNRPSLSTKRDTFYVLAPPLFWGSWVPIWAQMGITGPEPDKHITVLEVYFEIAGNMQSSFSVEIKGGDRVIRSNGPGNALVEISGNVATQISIRLKSHSLPLNVRVIV